MGLTLMTTLTKMIHEYSLIIAKVFLLSKRPQNESTDVEQGGRLVGTDDSLFGC